MKLTYFRQRRHEYPERDDEGNLAPLELDVEDMVLGRVAVAAVGGGVVVPDYGVLTHSFLMKQLPLSGWRLHLSNQNCPTIVVK